MDKEEKNVVTAWATGILIGLLFCFSLWMMAVATPTKSWQKEAIASKCASYNGTTGEFEWRTPMTNDHIQMSNTPHIQKEWRDA